MASVGAEKLAQVKEKCAAEIAAYQAALLALFEANKDGQSVRGIQAIGRVGKLSLNAGKAKQTLKVAVKEIIADIHDANRLSTQLISEAKEAALSTAAVMPTNGKLDDAYFARRGAIQQRVGDTVGLAI